MVDKGEILFEGVYYKKKYGNSIQANYQTGRPNCCLSCADWCRRTRWLITTRFVEKESGTYPTLYDHHPHIYISHRILTCRLIIIPGICCRSIDNLQLLRVKDLQYNSCCCCSCGTITIYSSDETHPVWVIRGIPNGHHIFKSLRDAVNALHGNAKLELGA